MVADARMLDLVTELMRKGHGQMHILKRIKRAASQNEVISVNERKYVESLTEKFLRASQKKEPPKSIAEPILMQQVKPAPQERVNKSSFETVQALYLHLQYGHVVSYSMLQNRQVILDNCCNGQLTICFLEW